MFPNNYSFNPGVVLDPVTMTPMISNGGSITVNPLGVPMRPQQKIWQKMFIQDIPQEFQNEAVVKLLKEFGNLKNFRRMSDSRGRLLSFCHFEFQTGEEIMRVRRLFSNIRILDRVLQLKISAQTQNFIKEWMTMQKDEWRKKLLAPGMNQAKQYDTIQIYHQREDKQYRRRIDDTLRTINVEVRKIAQDRMRDEERKEHPREKQREKRQKQFVEDMKRKFNQKEDFWLKREREKEREYRKDREKEREREKTRNRRIDREMDLQPEEQAHRIFKFQAVERRKALQREQQDDLDLIFELNPPEPEDHETHKKTKFTISTELRVGESMQGEMLVILPEIQDEEKRNQGQTILKNEMFQGWEKQEDIDEEQRPRIQLNLPEIVDNKEENEEKKLVLIEIAKQVPQSKLQLWQYPIGWDLLAKSVVFDKKIRPWLQKRSVDYMGGVQQKFIGLVEKKLLSRSHPDKIIGILRRLLDDDAEEFVIKLWRTLIFEYLKLKEGIE